jgi:hypothetical protein
MSIVLALGLVAAACSGDTTDTTADGSVTTTGDGVTTTAGGETTTTEGGSGESEACDPGTL